MNSKYITAKQAQEIINQKNEEFKQSTEFSYLMNEIMEKIEEAINKREYDIAVAVKSSSVNCDLVCIELRKLGYIASQYMSSLSNKHYINVIWQGESNGK